MIKQRVACSRWRFSPLAWLAAICLLTVGWCDHRLEADDSFANERQPAVSQAGEHAEIASEDVAFFEDQVFPIFSERCFECHSHEYGDASGQLMLDSLAAMLTGGTRGASVRPGKAEHSLLLQAVTYEDDELRMPPDGKLGDAEIAAIAKWIDSGAAMPESMLGEFTEPNESADDASSSHWAYQPPQPLTASDELRQEFPHFIDRAVVKNLRSVDLEMSPRTSRPTLVRRLFYDLTGFPPSAEVIDGYVDDPRSDREATTALVDRLLASPHFGERWARYWMDVARYADNKGYVFQEDREYPEAYQYRDWLIDVFNHDMPYDEFILKQLAADRVAAEGDFSDLPALGFLTLGRRFLNNKHDIIDDRLDVVSRGTLGMTLACARCHDHKYDPISQADYYSMYGIFLNTEEPGGEPWPHRLVEREQLRPSFILIRGAAGNRGDQVPRRFVSFLDASGETFDDSSGRVELAEKITSRDNPLTARVMANRIWMHMTGSSLVESPSDFGTRCPQPVQQPLLDALALEFMEGGWSMKHLIRSIALSDTYAQSSFDRPEASAVDSQNAYYWRMNRRRLDFEAMRDTLLSVAGVLDASLHGKSVRIDQPDLERKRTVYAYIDRQNLPNLFRTFDFAGPDTHSPQRAETSVPQQGLYLLNSDFMAKLAGELGEKSQQVAGTGDYETRIRWLFQQVFARRPEAREIELAKQFIADTRPRVEPLVEQHWTYGYGPFNPESGLLAEFNPLPFFNGERWQGGSEVPDDELGWCMLSATGGHPGNDLQHAVVKRWTAPREGTAVIHGRLEHGNDRGDGVRGSVLINGERKTEWSVANGAEGTRVEPFRVKAGDTVDFVTDCISGPAHDSFTWKFRLQYTDGDRERYVVERDLPHPIPEPLDPWAQLAQALMATNELVHID